MTPANSEERIAQILKLADMPVDVGFVARNLGIAWGTARYLLLELAVKGKLKALKTTKSYVFVAKDQEGPADGR